MEGRDFSAAAQAYKNAAFALFILAVFPYGAQYVFTYVFALLKEATGLDFTSAKWFEYFMSFAPVYLVGMPLCLLLMRSVPKEDGPVFRLGAKDILTCALICFPIMYIGNTLGILSSSLLSAGKATNDVAELAIESSMIKVIPLVVISPLLEEFIFRKQLLDRIAIYGEKAAIVFSALAFALIHGNLYQFFYAFGHGLLYGYIYIRTRRLRYSVLLHMMVNIIGSVVAPFILGSISAETLESFFSGQVSAAELMPEILWYGLFLFAEIALGIAGLFVLKAKLPCIKIYATKKQLPDEWVLPIVYCNTGALQLFLVCGIFIVLSL